MAILVGIGLAIYLLYAWLTGHWFARILMLPVCFLAAGELVQAMFIIDATSIRVVAAVAAWPLSGVPTFYHRRRTPPLRLTPR